MAGLLHKLENNEAILLMYLADELPVTDRADVERMLTRDAALRAHLESLRILHGSVIAGLNKLDAGTETLLPDDVVARQVGREMRRYQLELAARPAASIDRRVRRFPRWTYPIAAAAAAFFLLLGLWGVGVFDFSPGIVKPISNVTPGQDDGTSEAFAADLQRSLVGRPLAALDEADRHLSELRRGDDEDSLLPTL